MSYRPGEHLTHHHRWAAPTSQRLLQSFLQQSRQCAKPADNQSWRRCHHQRQDSATYLYPRPTQHTRAHDSQYSLTPAQQRLPEVNLLRCRAAMTRTIQPIAELPDGIHAPSSHHGIVQPVKFPRAPQRYHDHLQPNAPLQSSEC